MNPSWERVGVLRRWIDENATATEDPRVLRILKISEELGEVSEAVHAATGANPRKPMGQWDAVHRELADVIVTAMVALVTCTPYASDVLDRRLDELIRRLGL